MNKVPIAYVRALCLALLVGALAWAYVELSL